MKQRTKLVTNEPAYLDSWSKKGRVVAALWKFAALALQPDPTVWALGRMKTCLMYFASRIGNFIRGSLSEPGNIAAFMRWPAAMRRRGPKSSR